MAKKSTILHCFTKLRESNLLEAIKISRMKPVSTMEGTKEETSVHKME
jgi:hypothetical protein